MTRGSLTIGLVVLLGAAAAAADHQVGPGQSIQAAIDAAAPGDRVLVQPGTYVEHIDFKGKAIHVLGPGGAAATILSGSGSLGPVVTFHAGETPASVLQGFTIRDGVHQPITQRSGYGGGVSAWGGVSGIASPTIEDCVIRDNQAIQSPGGGVAGAPVMRRCVLVDNYSSDQDGAAVYGAPTMTDCLVASNFSLDGDGGGVAVTGGTAQLEDVTFVENRTRYGYGGGLAVKAGAHASVTRCVFVLNTADFLGQGSVRGGAVYVAPGATAVLDRCTVTQNGGKVPSCPGTCPEDTGGVYGPAVVKSSVVRDNAASQLWSVASANYCNVQGGALGVGNFDADPLFVFPGSDLHLRPGSPCIDAGDPNVVDPDGSVADVGAHPFARLYALDNIDPSTWTDPSWPQASTRTGGKLRLRLLADASDAGRPYWILGSAAGTWPGTPIGPGIVLPLNIDSYFFHTALFPNTLPLVASTGLIDPSGLGGGEFLLPPGLGKGLAGTTLHHAAVVFHPSPPWAPAWTTEAVGVELVE